MTYFPDVTVEVAFTTNFYDTPTWTDVTDYCIGFDSLRGRTGPLDVCDPGTAQFVFDNSNGAWDPDDAAGPFYGHLRPNKLIRASVTISGNTHRLFTGYIDSLRRTWPGGAEHSLCTVTATDRFKQLARMTITTTRAAETATARLTALLASVAFKSINPNAYSSRTVIGHEYDGDNALQSAQDVARSDGGILFCDSSGTVIFQPATFRQTNSRSTSSQATFGNHGVAVPIEDLESPVDDAVMGNDVTLTDGHGVIHHIANTAADDIDGLIEVDLGSTMLDISSQADDRVAEVLNLLVDAKPRYERVTINVLDPVEAALLQAVQREISDRVTISFIHPGRSTGTARQQFVESIAHAVMFGEQPQWFCTFGLSALPGAASVGRTAIP